MGLRGGGREEVLVLSPKRNNTGRISVYHKTGSGLGSSSSSLVETPLAHGCSESLGQRDDQSEHFRGLLGHHGHLGAVIAACQTLDDGSHDGLQGERERLLLMTGATSLENISHLEPVSVRLLSGGL